MVGEFERISLDDASSWREAVALVEHDFGHTWEHAKILALSHPGQSPFLLSYRFGAEHVVSPLIERPVDGHTDVTTPPGYSGFVSNGAAAGFAADWPEYAASQGWVCGYLAIHPVLANAVPLDGALEHNGVYALELQQPVEQLFANLDRNRRRELRGWEARSWSLVHDRSRLTEFLVDEYPRFMGRVGASASYDRSPDAIRYLAGLENVLLVGAGDPDIEAVYLFAHTPFVATAMVYVSVPGARDHATALRWYGILKLRDQGVPLLNLGGGVRENDSIALAKQRFGAQRRPLRAARQIYDRETYTQLSRAAGFDPADGSFFPAYRMASSS